MQCFEECGGGAKQLHVMERVGVACRKLEQPEVRLHSIDQALFLWELLLIFCLECELEWENRK